MHPNVDLVKTIGTLRQLHDELRAKGTNLSEASTKAAFIAPLMTALGWDTTSPFETIHEFKHDPSHNPVDYVFVLDEKPVLMVEAKALHVTVSDPKINQQFLIYAMQSGIRWCLITNGVDFRLYNTHAPVAIEEKLFWEVSLTDDDPSLLCERMQMVSKHGMKDKMIELLWKYDKLDKQVNKSVNLMLSGKDTPFLEFLSNRVHEPVDEIRESLQRAAFTFAFPFTGGSNTLSKPKSEPVPMAQPIPFSEPSAGKQHYSVTLPELMQAGYLQPGNLMGNYNGTPLDAKLQPSGHLLVGNNVCSSPSKAAGLAVQAITGKQLSFNGWSFWQVKLQSGHLTSLASIRDQYLSEKK